MTIMIKPTRLLGVIFVFYCYYTAFRNVWVSSRATESQWGMTVIYNGKIGLRLEQLNYFVGHQHDGEYTEE